MGSRSDCAVFGIQRQWGVAALIAVVIFTFINVSCVAVGSIQHTDVTLQRQPKVPPLLFQHFSY